MKLPCNEENLAFLAVLISKEIKIKDSIAALVSRQRRSEGLVGLLWAPNFLNHSFLILKLEEDESMVSLCFQLQELQFTFITDCHSGCCARLTQTFFLFCNRESKFYITCKSQNHYWIKWYTCTILSLFFLYYFKLFPCCAYLYVLMSHNLAFIKTKLLIIFSTQLQEPHAFTVSSWWG